MSTARSTVDKAEFRWWEERTEFKGLTFEPGAEYVLDLVGVWHVETGVDGKSYQLVASFPYTRPKGWDTYL